MSPRSRNDGFTLVDSLVAIAILALALPTLFDLVRSAVWRVVAAERKDSYWRAADRLMTESMADLGRRVGIQEGAAGDVTWTVETSRYEGTAGSGDSEPSNNLIRVKVTVRGSGLASSDDPATIETVALVGPPG